MLALGCFLAARSLALRELDMVAAASATLLVSAVGAVVVRRGALAVRRRVGPARVQAGEQVRVDLAVRNRGRIGGGPVLFSDVLPPRLNASARLALPSLPPGAERTLAYILRPSLRGRYTLGPLEVALTDPFGLVMRRRPMTGTSTVVVYPTFEPVHTLPRAYRRMGSVRRSPLLGQGDELYALRAYQEGDDLKKIHWPSSLRTGDVVVRQEELLREPGVVIVLDTCAPKHAGKGAGASLEAAVSACASIAALAVAQGAPLQILTAGGPLLRGRRPSRDDVLEALALVDASPHTTLLPALRTPGGRMGDACVVLITPGLSRPELATLAAVAGGASGGAAVLVESWTFDERRKAQTGGRRFGRGPARGADALAVLGLPVVRLRAGDSFREMWEKGVRRVAVAR